MHRGFRYICIAVLTAALPLSGCREAETGMPATVLMQLATPEPTPELVLLASDAKPYYAKKSAPAPSPLPATNETLTMEDTDVPTPVPTEAPAETAAPTPEPTAAPEPAAVKTPKPTKAPAPKPAKTPRPTPEPTLVPTFTPEPTAAPVFTPVPTAAPTPEPTATPEPAAAPVLDSSMVNVPGGARYGAADIALAARVAYREAGRTEEGQRAVLCVILNRVESGRWPNSVSEVCYQKNQFSVVKSDTFLTFDVPGSLYDYANDVFNGNNRLLGSEVMSFRAAQDDKSWGERTYVGTYGGNDFYS